jgi:2-C-methyl-D-erythritol 4-phosphate cytidylyltransferase/2-C-methyl-D-erythritol 2,4-cyclodiphosphate synthase
LHRIGAVLVAAGSSRRAGPGLPKQFRNLGLRPMFIAALEPLLGVCDEVVVVVPESDVDRAADILVEHGIVAGGGSGRPDGGRAPGVEGTSGRPRVVVVAGGRLRQDSVGAGLATLSDDVDVVLIHDAARPFASLELCERVAAAAIEHGAVVPVVPVKDTVKRVEEGRVVATLDRAVLGLAQTPQAFVRETLLSAREAVGDAGVTDDAQCVEIAGGRVAVVDGESGNVKVTDAWDMELASLRSACDVGLDAEARVGTGSDCHRLVEGRPLVLCGTEVPFDRGLDGWSDADVATHAVIDALLGAIGERDIGRMFPPGDERYRGIASTKLLARVSEIVGERGFDVGSVDVTITAEEPTLSPFIEDMRSRLAASLGVPRERVSVKATTTEGTGAEGRGEAMSAAAVAVVRRSPEGGNE